MAGGTNTETGTSVHFIGDVAMSGGAMGARDRWSSGEQFCLPFIPAWLQGRIRWKTS
jgi:hypothetical protein